MARPSMPVILLPDQTHDVARHSPSVIRLYQPIREVNAPRPYGGTQPMSSELVLCRRVHIVSSAQCPWLGTLAQWCMSDVPQMGSPGSHPASGVGVRPLGSLSV